MDSRMLPDSQIPLRRKRPGFKLLKGCCKVGVTHAYLSKGIGCSLVPLLTMSRLGVHFSRAAIHRIFRELVWV